MKEFKDITGYEGLYYISSNGFIKSKLGYISNGWEDKPLGYRKVRLYKNKVAKTYYLHRLVAIAYIRNPHNKPCVNHIDNDPSNNNCENLEWCTHQENMTHCLKQKRFNTKGISVIDTESGAIFKSITEAAESIGMKPNTLTYKLSGKRKNTTHLKYMDTYAKN